ncbi:MAG: hypothetical protein MJZ66_04255 [Bacteroidales bacterium]|nr:hypothetical protein [Bacteroidales bacterium]
MEAVKEREKTTFNPIQMQLINIFNFCKSEEGLSELKNVLFEYYTKKVQEEADRLWDEGTLNAEAIEKIGKEHWRTKYQTA